MQRMTSPASPPSTDPESQAAGAPRRYTSTRRARQAAQTRSDVLLVAVRLFGRDGWTKTTLAAIAEEAGVAVETIYSGFGSKKALLKAAMDVAIVGDAEPVALLERDQATQILQLPPAELLRQAVAMQAEFYSSRVAGMWATMLEAAAGDDEIATWCLEQEQRRRETAAVFLERAAGRPLDPTLLDLAWAVISPEMYTKLTTERGWSRTTWEQAMTDILTRLVIG